MLKKYGLEFRDMAVVFLIWMCLLPLGLLLVPVLGWGIGLVVVVGLLIFAIVICWMICGWKVFR